MKYTDFVKSKYDSVRHLPSKERMAEIAKMWRASGHAKPANVRSTPASRVMPKKEKVKGKGLFGLDLNIPNLAGGALHPRKVKPQESDLTLVARNVPANQFAYMTAPFGDAVPIGIGSRMQVAPGMAMPDKMTTPFGNAPPKKERKSKKVKGGGLLSEGLSMLGLGLPMEDKPKPEGNPKPVEGGGLLSESLSMLGLGLPMGMKDSKKPHKLSDAKMKKIIAHVRKHKGATYTKHLKGAGFFDDAFNGISQGFNAVVQPALSLAPLFL